MPSTASSAQSPVLHFRHRSLQSRPFAAALGYQLASIIAGGPAPLIATARFATCHFGYAISICIAACAVVSLVSASLMPDYTGKAISKEYDD